ncbi:hypothetical protein V2J09_017923, partial [Rumex salicifolius]
LPPIPTSATSFSLDFREKFVTVTLSSFSLFLRGLEDEGVAGKLKRFAFHQKQDGKQRRDFHFLLRSMSNSRFSVKTMLKKEYVKDLLKKE